MAKRHGAPCFSLKFYRLPKAPQQNALGVSRSSHVSIPHKGLDTPKTAASILHAFFEVLPFTTLASSVNGKTSKKSVQKRRGGVWCV